MIADKKREKKENRRTKETKKGSQNMIKACIFDLDGTIADTVESIAHAVNRVLEHFGLVPRPVEAFNFYAGDGFDLAVERALKDAGDAEINYLQEGIRLGRAWFNEDPLYHVKPYPNMRETLDRAAGRSSDCRMFQQAARGGHPRRGERVRTGLFQPDSGADRRNPEKAVSDRCARDCRRTRCQTGRVSVLWRYQYGYADRKRRRHVYRWCDVGIPPAPGADRQPCDGAARPAGGNLNAFSQKESGKIKRTEEKTRMGEYTEECINTFLMNQGQLFDEPVAENYDEAEAFLEDCLAVVADNLDDVRAYMEEEGMDVEEMSDAELEEQSEVFALPDGQYLIVMG